MTFEASNISEVIYDTSTKTKIVNKKSQDSFQVIRLWYDCQWLWRYFKVIRLFHIKFLVNGKSYYRLSLLVGNHILAFDGTTFDDTEAWRTFEGHFSLGCHFHVQYPRNCEGVSNTITQLRLLGCVFLELHYWVNSVKYVLPNFSKL